ncbi:hypothetical protein C8J57DRAFT_182652 [Mycena rebaudengoi]|nr:hypothetical protein C8J57DRAFT_303855 [Mycena rebaudengoi]KAJ7277100.1 hypothetical protein C8J57DRAFT_182652 [Mycena rebaudengoi]
MVSALLPFFISPPIPPSWFPLFEPCLRPIYAFYPQTCRPSSIICLRSSVRPRPGLFHSGSRTLSALAPLLAHFPVIISFYVPQIPRVHSLPSASFEPAYILAVPADDEEVEISFRSVSTVFLVFSLLPLPASRSSTIPLSVSSNFTPIPRMRAP